MHVSRIAWRPYRIPFAVAFQTAHGGLSARTGAILEVMTDVGLVGVGEIAPLPSFGGTLGDALACLSSLTTRLIGVEVADLAAVCERLSAERAVPTSSANLVMAGLDLAAIDLLAQHEGHSAAAALGSGRTPTGAVAVNAILGAPGLVDVVAEARVAVSAGFRCVKLKVGSAPTMEDDVRRVAAVRDAIGPGCRLRLDANGAWTVSEATAMLQALRPYDLELVEQPVPPGSPAELAAVRRACPEVRIAADESVTDIATARAIIAAQAADVLVVKPMLLGGPRRALEIIRLAEAAGLEVVVTSMLESGIGVAGALHVAANLRQPALACGIATTELLEDDLIEQRLVVAGGVMQVPAAPGLGVALDRPKLARYALSEGAR